MSYAVIFTYSSNVNPAVYLFDTEAEAKLFLLESYREELRIYTEENGWNSVGEISDDGWYAKIQVDSDDGDPAIDLTELRIGNIYQ